MKTVLVGIGSYGYGWYKTVKNHPARLEIAAVDRDPRAALLLDPATAFYTNLTEALDREQPDFMINLTPPAVHTALNHLAFDRRLPVLCEKPISEDYAEAVSIVERSVRENIPFMIAENYRRNPTFRKAHRLIRDGVIGELATVNIQFSKEAYFEKEYLIKMAEPLLVDVSIHHMDLIRYLTGREGRRIFARSFRPRGSRYPGNAAANLYLEMDDGIQVNYSGSLSAKEAETGWAGDWRIEGTAGVMKLDEKTIRVIRPGQEDWVLQDFSDMDSSTTLDEFLRALAEGRQPETNGADYLNTQKLIHFARESISQERICEIS